MLNTFIKKTLAAVLAFALVLSVVPGVAMTAQAAEGDASSNGYVLFEETFDGTKEQLLSGYTYSGIASNRVSIQNGCVTFADYTANQYLEITLSDLRIPAPSSRCYVGLKLELDVSSTTQGRNASFQIAAANGTTSDFVTTEGSAVTAVISTQDASATGYLKAGEISSLTLRIGARANANGGTVSIEGVKISLVMGELGTSLGQDFGRFLECKDGYFQLKRDLEFSSYNSSTGAQNVTNLVTGNNAVLDLNGHTLTIAEGSKLNIANNAKIVDTSAGKTGKIVCGADALKIANTAHPTLPIYTGNAYVFTEPDLEAEKHIFVNTQNADQFALHFRPGFGTVGGVNVREIYLAGGNSGIKMSAFITSKDIYGNETAVTYNSSAEIKLDNMFNGMYAVPAARGEMAFAGFEKYESLEITLKLISDTGAACILPTYTVNNDKVTKHYASEEQTLSGNGGFTLETAIPTTGKLIMEFDANIPEVFTTNNSAGFGFENRNGSTRCYAFSVGNGLNSYKNIANKDIAGEAHIRLEIDLATFSTVCKVNGVADAAVAPAAGDLADYQAAWHGKSSVVYSGAWAAATVELNNVMIYTIETA